MTHFSIKAIFFGAMLLVILQHTGWAQEKIPASFDVKKQATIEDLEKFTKQDTARVNALLRIVNTAIFLKEKKEVIAYLPEAMSLSRSLNYTAGMGNYYLQKASYHKSSSDYTNSLLYYDSALYVTDAAKVDELLIIKEMALEQKGVIYYTLENYYTALDYFFEALKYVVAGKEKRKIRIYTFITESYTHLGNTDKAGEYAKLNIDLVEKDSNILHRLHEYLSYIEVCINKNQFREATNYLDKMSVAIPDKKETQINFGYYLKRGIVDHKQQRYKEAYEYFKQASQYAVEGGHDASKCISLYYLSTTALQLGYMKEAKEYGQQALARAATMSTKQPRIEAMTNLASYYEKAGDPGKAYQLVQQALLLKDSFIQENNIKQLHVMGAVYESGKQQNQIANLQTEKVIQAASVKKKSMLNIVFVVSIVVLLILGYLGYSNFKRGQQVSQQQQALQQQKISELEKDKQLVSIDAMLKVQEEERSRIAKDLHDGLGSILSGTKLSFVNVKEMMNLPQEINTQFDKSLSMLDNGISDLRKVAHNLMPEALVKFGLQDALRDFCSSIEYSSGIKVLYHQYGEVRELENTAEMFIYRIVQELVNNAVKHAGATQIIVQLSMSSTKTAITVEDNGKGFDKLLLSVVKGAGMMNINYRVQYFNGTTDIITSPGNGTSVNIQLNA